MSGELRRPHAAGRMFWFIRNKFCGSDARFTVPHVRLWPISRAHAILTFVAQEGSRGRSSRTEVAPRLNRLHE